MLPALSPLRCKRCAMPDDEGSQRASAPAEPELEQIIVDRIGGKLAGLARVAASKQEQFLSEIKRALSMWTWDVILHSKQGSPDRILYQMLQNAEALHDQLSDVVQAVETGESNLMLNVAVKLEGALAVGDPPASISDMCEHVSYLIDVISRAVLGRSRPRGALPGIPGYPGLDALVFRLERAARRAGGKFTAHRKFGGKGRLIDALNEMRVCLRAIEGQEHLTESLPHLGSHPAATYEDILRAARANRESVVEL
jgi:hypothetical protein